MVGVLGRFASEPRRNRVMSRTPQVFLSHNSHDKPAVIGIANYLTQQGIGVFLDKWNLVPGQPWEPDIEEALETCEAALLCLGPHGEGPVHHKEMEIAVRRMATDPHFRVVGVLLPGIGRDRGAVPDYVSAYTWVEFEATVEEPQGLDKLVAGVRAQMPGASRPPLPQIRAKALAGSDTAVWLTARVTKKGDVHELELFRGERRIHGPHAIRLPSYAPPWSAADGEALGEALTDALFGSADDVRREIARRVEPVYDARHQHLTLAGLSVRLCIEAEDDSVATLPWRSLVLQHRYLERTFPWSVAVAKPGLPREAVDVHFPCGVLLLGAEGSDHLQALAARLTHLQPTLRDGYVRIVTHVADLASVGTRVRPEVIYFIGTVCPETRRLRMADDWLSPIALQRALPSTVRPKLLYLNDIDAAAPVGWRPAQAWSPQFPYVITNPEPLSRARGEALGEAVMAEILAKREPAWAVKEAVTAHDANEVVDLVSPAVLSRALSWRAEGQDRPAQRTLEEVLFRLDRIDQRDLAAGRINRMVRGAGRSTCFFYYGMPVDRPVSLGKGLYEHVVELMEHIHVVPLSVSTLPEEEGYELLPTVMAGIQNALHTHDPVGARRALLKRHREGGRRKTLFWADWGCYPDQGRKRTLKECAEWAAAEMDVLKQVLPSNAQIYWVSSLSVCVEEEEKIQIIEESMPLYLKDYNVDYGSYVVEILPRLGAVEERHIMQLLLEYQDVFRIDDRDVARQAAETIMDGQRQRPYSDVVDQLRRLAHVGPTRFNKRKTIVRRDI